MAIAKYHVLSRNLIEKSVGQHFQNIIILHYVKIMKTFVKRCPVFLLDGADSLGHIKIILYFDAPPGGGG